MTAEEQVLQTQLAAGRILIGGGALLTPRLMGRVFGIDPDTNPAASYIGRLFGVRAVLMAVQLLSVDPAARTQVLRQNVAVDLVDAVAAVAATRSGALGRWPGIAATGAALFEAGLGLRLLALDRPVSAGRARPRR